MLLKLIMNYKYLIIQMELRQSGSLLGYRAMWQRLKKKYKISIPRYYFYLNYKVYMHASGMTSLDFTCI